MTEQSSLVRLASEVHDVNPTGEFRCPQTMQPRAKTPNQKYARTSASRYCLRSGPFIEEGVLVGKGLTILATSTPRRGAKSLGRGAVHQARAAQLPAQKMGAARGPDRYLAVRR